MIEALEAAVDRLDGATEAGVVDDAVMRRLAVAAGLRHPVPQRSGRRLRGIVGQDLRVVDQVDADVAAGRAVVEVPADLQPAAAVVPAVGVRAAAGTSLIGAYVAVGSVAAHSASAATLAVADVVVGTLLVDLFDVP